MELPGQMTDWKIQELFEIIRMNFSKFYNLSEHLAVDEVIVKLKERVVCKQYIPKNRKCFGTNIFRRLYWIYISTFDVNVYLGKDRQRAAQHLTATHATVTNLMGEGRRIWP